MADEDELAFAENITAFKHCLIENLFEDAFACLLLLSNALARIQSKSQDSSESKDARREILDHCTLTLANKLVEAVGEINSKRAEVVKAYNATHQSKQKNSMKMNQNGYSHPMKRKPKLKTKPKARNKRGNTPPRTRGGERESATISKADGASAQSSRPGTNNAQDNLNPGGTNNEEAARQQLEALYEKDVNRLSRSAALCRLLQSVVILLDKDSKENSNGNGKSGSEYFVNGFKLFSQLVLQIFSEKCIAAKNELSAHRSLATRTTQLGVVEAAEDDPYLKALSILLENAHGFVEDLTLGELAIAATTNGNEQTDQLETFSLVEELDDRAAEFTVPVLDAIYKDRKVDNWLARADEIERDQTDRMRLSDKEVAKLSSLLNDLMEVQQYCSKFTQFLQSFYDYYGKNKPNKISDRNQKMVGAYVCLERLWLNHSFGKAIKTAQILDIDGIKVNSLVDNTFYVIRNGFARAVHTGSEHAASAIANFICHGMQENYTKKLRSLMSESLQAGPSEVDSDDGEDGGKKRLFGKSDSEKLSDQLEKDIFAAALESDIHGLGRLSTALLCAINSVELSAKFIRELVEIIRNEFEENFPEKMVTVEMALQGLEEMQIQHDGMKVQAIQEVVASCITPTQETAIEEAVESMNYRLNNASYDNYERNDPFVHRFLSQHVHSNANLTKCRKKMTPTNYLQCVCEMSKAIASIFVRELLKSSQFNALGALRLEKDISSLLNGLIKLTEDFETAKEGYEEDDKILPEDSIRSYFMKLKQISFLVQQPLEVDKNEIHYPLDSCLSDEEVNLVLSKRAE